DAHANLPPLVLNVGNPYDAVGNPVSGLPAPLELTVYSRRDGDLAANAQVEPVVFQATALGLEAKGGRYALAAFAAPGRGASIPRATGGLDWTPSAAPLGGTDTYTFNVKVTDADGHTTTRPVIVHVVDAPVLDFVAWATVGGTPFALEWNAPFVGVYFRDPN